DAKNIALDAPEVDAGGIEHPCVRLGDRVERAPAVLRCAGDNAQHLRGRRLLFQRLSKVLPSLDKFVPVFFKLLFQIGTRLTHPIASRSRLRSGRTKLAAACWTLCAFERQGYLVGTVTGLHSGRPSQRSSLSILTEPHDELAAFHSITSPARASRMGGMVR